MLLHAYCCICSIWHVLGVLINLLQHTVMRLQIDQNMHGFFISEEWTSRALVGKFDTVPPIFFSLSIINNRVNMHSVVHVCLWHVSCCLASLHSYTALLVQLRASVSPARAAIWRELKCRTSFWSTRPEFIATVVKGIQLYFYYEYYSCITN